MTWRDVMVLILGVFIGSCLTAGLSLMAERSLAAAPTNGPFLQMWNTHATDMNKLAELLQKDVADRKQFGRAFKSFETLVADPGWLK